MTAIWAIVTLGVIVGTGYYAFSLHCAWSFFRARRCDPETRATPPATLLKPLRGLGVELEANLESFFTIDYPDYQILFAVADPKDPAIPVVERLRRRYPNRDTALVVNSKTIGANRKVSSLCNVMQLAKHDVLILSDSDIRVRPDYLRRIVQPLANPDVGLVTCLYRGLPSRGAPTRLETLYVNADFMPQILVAHRVDGFQYAFGATIAIRRAALEAIGGFKAIADYLADDYQLGYQITGKGYRVALSPLVVETHLDAETWRDLAQHQLRWARTNRVCRPGGYFCSVLTHGTSWATAFLVVSGFSAIGWQVFLATTTMRLIQVATIGGGYIGSPTAIRDLWLIPVKDLLSTAIWLASFFGSHVEWGGERLLVRRDGKMTPIAPEQIEAPAAISLNGRAAPPSSAPGAPTIVHRNPEQQAEVRLASRSKTRMSDL